MRTFRELGNRLPFDDAIKRAKANKFSVWPKRESGNRLEPECWPNLSPSFHIDRDSKIFTVGSCFARNVERSLALSGFDAPVVKLGSGLDSQFGINAINKYTPPGIFQELAWALRLGDKSNLTKEDVRDLFFELPDGRVIDMHLFGAKAEEFDVALARRQVVADIFRSAFSSDVIVVTLGFVEAWWDAKTELSILATPTRAMSREAGRFYFARLDYNACYDYVRRTVELLNSHGGKKKFLITTSPVPLGRTFTTDDVIVANCYSKSLLRTVAGKIAEEFDGVDYFPSFESVMLTKQTYVWQDDLVHVEENFVNQIMTRVKLSYVEGTEAVSFANDLIASEIVALVARKDFGAALEKYHQYNGDILLNENPDLQFACAELTEAFGLSEQAARHARAAANGAGAKPEYVIGAVRILRGNGHPEEADRIERAHISSSEADMQRTLEIIRQLSIDKRYAEAADLLDRQVDATKLTGHSAVQLSKTYELAQRPEAVLPFLLRVLKHEPTYPRLVIEVVSRLRAEQRWEEMLPILDRLLAADKSNCRIFRYKQLCLRQLGRVDEAIACAQEAFALFPNNNRAIMDVASLSQPKTGRKWRPKAGRKRLAAPKDAPVGWFNRLKNRRPARLETDGR